jgi:hypothetical protein
LEAGRIAQAPSTDAPVATLQAWQSVGSPPPQAVLQQTPSEQKPLWHSKLVAQLEPAAS